ncbi:MAG: RsmD family RNA methyltransferase [Phycisphaerales bacterium]|nr:RsmD family RNA methyltransferase [Phycisphaerales bacterium]
MRIIAGQHRGHRLHANAGDTTRPITDRAKQSLFDALQDCFVGGGQRVMDCFSGSGSMGLECLSRGAAKAIFVERDRGALATLRRNLDEMKMTDRAVILPIDAYASSEELHPEMHDLTIAFVDPPYSHTATGHWRNKLDALLRRLASNAMIDGGIISFRHPTNITIDAAALGVKIVRELRYGDMGITWLTKA